MAQTPRNLPIFLAPWMVACSFALALALAPDVHAQPLEGPQVVVLQVELDTVAQARDRHFTEELGLALEGLLVRAQLPPPSFADASLAQQLAYVRSLGSAHNVVATVWLRSAGNSMLLHLVALQTERALVRIVKTAQRPTLEAELALLARELLGEAYLFSRAHLAAPIDAAVETVRSVTATKHAERWELAAFGEGTLGIEGSVGPPAQLGAGAGAAIRVWKQFWIAASAHGLVGPSGGTRTVDVRGSEWGGSLGAGLRFPWGKIELGPLLRASFAQRRLDARTEQGAQRDLRTLSGRVAVGGEVSLQLSAGARLLLDGTLGTRLLRTAVRARSDGATLLRTAQVDASLRIGVALRFQ